jgi:glutathione synthase/RimK-type ligase-like ATP-grasp enzyme
MITLIGKGKDSKNLAALMGIRRNKTPMNPTDILILWGRKINVDLGNPFNHFGLGINKLRQLEILKEAGVPTIKFVKNKDDIINFITQFPIFGRKLFHKKGLDIKRLWFYDRNQIDGYNNAIFEIGFWESDFWTFWANTKKEFRIHVILTEEPTVMSCMKYREAGNHGLDPNPNNPDYIRNLESGWKMTEVTASQELKDTAVNAVKALRLDFGAVDIIKDQEGKYLVLEVNTAPGLDNKRLQFYSEGLKKLCQEQTA